MLFFEKKNQKTFASWHTRPTATCAAYANAQKFFASFFQKIRPFFLLAATLLLSACAVSFGVQPYGPDSFIVSERRAPVLGGGPEAQRVALAEAARFCQQTGRVFAPIAMGPYGNPYGAYGPTTFTAAFRCRPPA
jgi:negative regulator of sigma E activity